MIIGAGFLLCLGGFLRRGNHVSIHFSVGGSFTSSGYPHVSLPGCLAFPGLLSSFSSLGLGDGAPAMPGTGDCCLLGKVQSYSSPDSGISWGSVDSTLFRASPSQSRVVKLCSTTKEFLSNDRQPLPCGEGCQEFCLP